MIDTTASAPASATAAVCESMSLFGASPERGELDSRVVWDEDDAICALSEAIRVIVDGITVDGTQMADEREPLMWGFVNMLHSQVQRLDRAVDRIVPEMRDLERAQDGTEVKAWELQTLTDRAQNLGDRRDAFEKMRDLAADAYRSETGDTWRPRHGSHTSQTGQLTSAAIDARDFRRARKDRETQAHLPDGTLVAITGGKTVSDADAVWTTLDSARAKYGDMVLLHGGGPGVEKIAASWAEARGVNQIVCRPDWNAHGKAAPFRRNDELLNLLPKGVIAFPRLRYHRQPGRQGEAARHSRIQRRRLMATLPLPPAPVLASARAGAPLFAVPGVALRVRLGASRQRPTLARHVRVARPVTSHRRSAPLPSHFARDSAPSRHAYRPLRARFARRSCVDAASCMTQCRNVSPSHPSLRLGP